MMKANNALLLFVLLLAACSLQSSPAPISTLIQTQTPVPSLTDTPTLPATRTPRPTFTPTVTLVPCPNEPLVFSEISVVFHEKVNDKDCNEIIKYTNLTVEQFALIGYSTGIGQVNVFATPEAVTNYEYDWAKKMGCNPDSKDNIFNLWTGRNMQAQSTRQAVFLLVNLPGDAWRKAEEVERAHAIAHEITQVAETNILGSCQRRWQIPDWYGHGVAEYFADSFTQMWGLPPRPDDLSGCDGKLESLHAGERCIYMQAQLAFDLLAQKYDGRFKTALDVLTEMAKGKNFNQAFYDTYKISVSAFLDDFDSYRLNGYTVMPDSTSTP